MVEPRVYSLVTELLQEVRLEDPVKGFWHVDRNAPVVIWTDASSVAMGVVVEVGNVIVEDACWLRKATDCLHINVAELEAVGRGINLALT